MTHRLILILLLAALTACASPGTTASTASINPEGQTIIVWHSAEGDARRALLAQIDEFNATNAWRVLVVPEYHGSPAETARALETAIGAGRLPDLVLGRPLDVTRLGDAVMPIEPYAADAEYGLSRADLSDLFAGPLDANRDPYRNNELMSFPLGAEGTLLVYNADRLAAAGYLTPPTSWPLFREVCVVTTVDRNGDRQPDVYGFAFTPRAEFVSAWFRSRGVPLLMPDGRTIGFDGPLGAKPLETLSESAQGGCFYRTPGPAADIEAFSTGRVAMIFANSSDLRAIDQAVKDRGGFRWGVTPVPYGQQAVTFDVSGPAWIVLRSTPEKQLAAWLLARWFAGTDQTRIWAQRTGQLPLRKSALSELRNQYSETPAEAAALELMAYAQADPPVSYWPDVAEAATRAVLAVVAGDPPEVAHAQALDAVRQLVQP